jgi:hypothetical protein
MFVGVGHYGAHHVVGERRPVGLAIGLADDTDMRTQHHDVGYLEPMQQ